MAHRFDFSSRHIGPNNDEVHNMLSTLGCRTLDELIKKTAPSHILTKNTLDLGPGLTESEFLKKAKEVANKNQVLKSYLGQGYYGTLTPTVILRNILENPGWYTAYTPYQAEISQGRMEALLNFQTMVKELTALDIANASLLDEGTAAAEAMSMAYNKARKKRNKIFVDQNIFPQTKEILETRSHPIQVELVYGDYQAMELNNDFFAAIIQYPNALGEVNDYTLFAEKAHSHGSSVIAICDLLSLNLLKPPGQWGADIAVGTTQRFGVPMGFGGPHAGYIATKDDYKRSLPGRIIGVSKA